MDLQHARLYRLLKERHADVPIVFEMVLAERSAFLPCINDTEESGSRSWVTVYPKPLSAPSS